jgi:hypothetical protein
MKRVKITLVAILAVALAFTINACGGDDGNNDNGTSSQSTGGRDKDACIAEMAANKSNTPQQIIDACKVTGDIWASLMDGASFGTCGKAELEQLLNSSLKQIEQTCEAKIPEHSSSSKQDITLSSSSTVSTTDNSSSSSKQDITLSSSSQSSSSSKGEVSSPSANSSSSATSQTNNSSSSTTTKPNFYCEYQNWALCIGNNNATQTGTSKLSTCPDFYGERATNIISESQCNTLSYALITSTTYSGIQIFCAVGGGIMACIDPVGDISNATNGRACNSAQGTLRTAMWCSSYGYEIRQNQ